MQDYHEFPPINYFLRSLKGCPKSSLLYAELWKRKGDQPLLCVDKRSIRKDYMISPTLFRNFLSPLAFLGLISFIESLEDFQIEMMGKSNEQ